MKSQEFKIMKKIIIAISIAMMALGFFFLMGEIESSLLEVAMFKALGFALLVAGYKVLDKNCDLCKE